MNAVLFKHDSAHQIQLAVCAPYKFMYYDYSVLVCDIQRNGQTPGQIEHR